MATIQGLPIPSPVAYDYIEVSRAYDNNGSGRVVQLVFRGDKNTLRIASAQWVALGAKYTIREDGPYSEATVTIGGNSFDPGLPIEDQTAPQVGELADIRYEFRTDYVDISVFALPAVAKEAEATGDPAFYKKTIEDVVRNGQKLVDVSPLGNLPIARRIWAKLARGEESFPVARVSLTRIATFSGNLGLPQVPQGIPPVYTPISFGVVWNLPFSVRNMLPPIPVDPNTGQIQAPSGTAWGWKLTNNSTSLVTKTNQVEQVVSWTFAPYDLDIYPFI
jgi:hypothetical protein